ncbi:MAG: hypothetical protein AAF492_27505 [Verrucomicrobiota bacterium]
MFPETYEEWRSCITEKGGIALTEAYIQKRLRALQSPHDAETARFRELYGPRQLDQTVRWFERARKDAAPVPESEGSA